MAGCKGSITQLLNVINSYFNDGKTFLRAVERGYAIGFGA
jgi:hypothetical protein